MTRIAEATAESKLHDLAERANIKVVPPPASLGISRYLQAALVGRIHPEQMEQIRDRLFLRGVEVRERDVLDLKEGAKRSFEGLDLVLVLFEIGSHRELEAVAANARAYGVKHYNISRKSARWPSEICHPDAKHLVDQLANSTMEEIKSMVRTGLGKIDAEAEAALMLAAKTVEDNEELRKKLRDAMDEIGALNIECGELRDKSESLGSELAESREHGALLSLENEELKQRSTMPMPANDAPTTSTSNESVRLSPLEAIKFVKRTGLIDHKAVWDRSSLHSLLVESQRLGLDVATLVELLEES